MKLLLFLLAFIFSLNVCGQTKIETNVFSWNDTILKVGTERVIEFEYTLDGPCTVSACEEVGDNKQMYDTLIRFLTNHSGAIIQISKYVSKSDHYSQHWLESFEYTIQQNIIQRGVPETRVKTKAYDEDVQDEFKSKMEDLERENRLRHKRIRCFEVVIVRS